MAWQIDEEILEHYGLGEEKDRLLRHRLEMLRTQELLSRSLPPPPAAILDVGGGPGRYSAWLADLGYNVVLLDPVPLHVEQAAALGGFDARSGDARALEEGDASFDVVLLMGPLYHLVDRSERLQAWREAARVVRPGGLVAAALISRYAAVLDGTFRELSLDPDFRLLAERTAETGVLEAGAPDHPFTTAYFHHPEEAAPEVADAGLEMEGLFGIEGPGEWMPDIDARLDDDDRRELLLGLARRLEQEPSAVGISPHLLVVARRPGSRQP
jgi:SAM-dependent methyltransferase